MLRYIIYKRTEGKPYTRTSDVIKTNNTLEVGKFITYHQFGINRARIDKFEFCAKEFKVFLTTSK